MPVIIDCLFSNQSIYFFAKLCLWIVSQPPLCKIWYWFCLMARSQVGETSVKVGTQTVCYPFWSKRKSVFTGTHQGQCGKCFALVSSKYLPGHLDAAIQLLSDGGGDCSLIDAQNDQRQSTFQCSIPVCRRSFINWSRPCLLIRIVSIGDFILWNILVLYYFAPSLHCG